MHWLSTVGKGSGLHRNFPLPAGTDDIRYSTILDEALRLVKAFAPTCLVLSAGMDLYSGDPLGEFELTREGIRHIGESVAGLKLSTLIVMEGGYNNEDLGANITTLLENFS